MAEIILLIKYGPMDLIYTAKMCYNMQLCVIFTAANPNPPLWGLFCTILLYLGFDFDLIFLKGGFDLMW